MRLRRRRFEALVRQVLTSLPTPFRQVMDNVVVTVEDWPTAEDLAQRELAEDETLLGLYVGVPRTERDGPGPLLPDRIIIYQGPLEEACTSYRELVAEVRTTVVHEVAHHFGLSEERLVELGLG